MRPVPEIPLRAAVLVSLGALALAGCAGSQQRRGPPTAVINRVLATAPGEAQPSAIVAREVAYARDAREQGQVAAAEAYAAPGALQHTRRGPVPFAQIAPALATSGIETQWKTRAVVMSCDGALAVAQGRFADRAGKVGTYVTVWQRQDNGQYRWTYDVAGYDDPQPPARRQFEDGDIVVTAIDSIRGLVATCPPRGVDVPAPPAIPIGAEGAEAAQLSRDGTMRWRWEHRADGTKFVKAEYFYEGDWETGIEESLASTGEK